MRMLEHNLNYFASLLQNFSVSLINDTIMFFKNIGKVLVVEQTFCWFSVDFHNR